MTFTFVYGNSLLFRVPSSKVLAYRITTMKKIILYGLPTLALAWGLMATSIVPNGAEYEPILMSRQDMEAAVQLDAIRPIESEGKMWLYNDFIFLIEQYQGIHIIDNSDPENAATIRFIQIDGCTDLTMNNDILYANNAVDMIGIRGNTDFSSINVVSRNRNALPQVSSPQRWYDGYFSDAIGDKIVVRWIPYTN